MKSSTWYAATFVRWAIAGATLSAVAAFASDDRQSIAGCSDRVAQCRLDTRSPDALSPGPRLVFRVKPWADDRRSCSSDSPESSLSPVVGLSTPEVYSLPTDPRWNQSLVPRYTLGQDQISRLEGFPGSSDGSGIITVVHHQSPADSLVDDLRVAAASASHVNDDNDQHVSPLVSGEPASGPPEPASAMAPACSEAQEPTSDADVDQDAAPRSTHGAASPNREITGMGAGLIAVMLIFVFCL